MPGVTCCRTHRTLPLSLPHPTMVQLFHIAIATVGQRNERREKKKKKSPIWVKLIAACFLLICFWFFHESPILPWITDSPPSNTIKHWSTGPDWMAGRIECVSVCLLTQSISAAELLDLVSRKPAAYWDLLPNGCADWKTENRIGQEQDL